MGALTGSVVAGALVGAFDGSTVTGALVGPVDVPNETLIEKG